MKDIKNYFNFITFEKIISKQSNFVSDRNTNVPICNITKIKVKFTGPWLPCSTTPNVPTLLTQSPQAKNLAFKNSHPFISHCS